MIDISTIDNPGWRITIDLINAPKENKKFIRIEKEISDLDWYHCFIRNDKFEGACGSKNLIEVLSRFFHTYADDCIDRHLFPSTKELMHCLQFLQEWYDNQCDGDWEHCFGITLYTTSDPGWRLEIELDETELENTPFIELRIVRTDSNWVHCFVKNKVFNAYGGLFNAEELLAIFQNWAMTGG